jgi:hypothetical protein
MNINFKFSLQSMINSNLMHYIKYSSCYYWSTPFLWRWKQYVSPKRLYLPTSLHGVATQNKNIVSYVTIHCSGKFHFHGVSNFILRAPLLHILRSVSLNILRSTFCETSESKWLINQNKMNAERTPALHKTRPRMRRRESASLLSLWSYFLGHKSGCGLGAVAWFGVRCFPIVTETRPQWKTVVRWERETKRARVINEGLVSQSRFPVHGPRESAVSQPQNGPAMHLNWLPESTASCYFSHSWFHYFTSHI